MQGGAVSICWGERRNVVKRGHECGSGRCSKYFICVQSFGLRSALLPRGNNHRVSDAGGWQRSSTCDFPTDSPRVPTNAPRWSGRPTRRAKRRRSLVRTRAASENAGKRKRKQPTKSSKHLDDTAPTSPQTPITTNARMRELPPFRSIIQDNQDMDVALVKYRVSAVQVRRGDGRA